ncbi:MAG TPA: DNA-binding response regulator [Acidimicrobiaceae bacterium]|jgi:two-component system response regulator RegX3|nr:DNA-binding response regulator [Acidimicrobiaceae bacterium]
MRLLLVEDDPSISGPLASGLEREGFSVTVVDTGTAALEAEPVDVVLLDLGLPDLEGRVVCRELRQRSSVPILIVSARGDEIDRVGLLELGADDYLVKPFGFRELVARIHAILRRVGAAPSSDTHSAGPIEHAGLSLDLRSRQAAFHGDPVNLTAKEFDLLEYLTSDPGAVRTRDQIMREVWDEHWWGSSKTLDVHMASLRKKLSPEFIVTVRGVGFRLNEAAD